VITFSPARADSKPDDQQLAVVATQHADARPQSEPLGAQCVGEPVDALVQLVEGQLAAAVVDRWKMAVAQCGDPRGRSERAVPAQRAANQAAPAATRGRAYRRAQPLAVHAPPATRATRSDESGQQPSSTIPLSIGAVRAGIGAATGTWPMRVLPSR
jgi:hypothetical protein